MKITEKLHGQCFWLLTVARGVLLNNHLKMLEMFMFDRSVKLESFRFPAFFCKTVYSFQFLCVTEIFYVCWLKLFWN